MLKILITLFILCSCNTEIVVSTAEEVPLETEDKTELPTPPTPQPLQEEISIQNLNFTKISDLNPIYTGATVNTDCGYYLIGIRGAQRPSTFVFNNKVYFNIPCKTSDSSAGGWHWGVSHWTPADGMNWVDGKPGTVGENEVLSRTHLDNNGFILNSVRNTYFVDTGSGILGFTYKYFRNTEYTAANVPGMYPAEAVVTTSGYKTIGLSAASPEALLPSDIYVDEKKNASTFNLADDTWKGETKLESELYYEGGTVYVYNTTINSPTKDTYYISVATSTDMITYTMPTNFILKDYRYPNVFKFKNKLYMIAFSYIEEQWMLIPGTSLTEFDTSLAVELNLGEKIVGAGNWDDTPTFTSLPNDQPEIAGVEELDGKLYVFYMAGQLGQVRAPANGVSGAPYDSARAIGAYELKFDF